MNRLQILQRILDATDARRYLEIGVYNGPIFLRLRVRYKVAVDPEMRIGKRKKLKWLFENPCNFMARYHRVTSDEFFARARYRKPFDLVFIDGFHTYRQSLVDVENALDLLAEDGLIVLHDCAPPSESAARPVSTYAEAKSLGLKEWCGDVWKTIVHLRSLRQDLSVFVLDCDFGVGIVRRGRSEPMLDLDRRRIDRLSYRDLAARKAELLNLKPPGYLDEFLRSLDG